MELHISGEQLLAAVADAALVVDRDGRIREANAHAHEQFGYEAPGLIGRPIDLLVPVAVRAGHAAHRSRFAAAPRHVFGDVRGLFNGLRRDGSAFPVRITLAPISTAVGPMTFALVHDLSESIENEEMLGQAKQDQRRAIGQAERALVRHDALAQAVFGLSLAIDALGTESDPDALRRGLIELSQTLHRLIHDLSEEEPST